MNPGVPDLLGDHGQALPDGGQFARKVVKRARFDFCVGIFLRQMREKRFNILPLRRAGVVHRVQKLQRDPGIQHCRVAVRARVAHGDFILSVLPAKQRRYIRHARTAVHANMQVAHLVI
ncbi:hypothetical protein SDC9_177264 [bioreactor metagenome]|uniref:Uncharacterized protein n=1 Tax=bioreactor metagenome TaxID=1076179 RepID=A0A645GSI1_9ZZZZ